MSEKDNNLHKHHRDRLRKKFYESEGDALEPHELLEILLYSVNSQKNTNTIARALLKKFGTIYGVFKASDSELRSVDGIGEQSIALLKLQAALFRRYNIDMENDKGNMQLTPKNSGKYAASFFYGYANETAIVFALDGGYRILSSVPVGKGSIDKVNVSVRDVVKAALETKAVYIVLAHNHPNGTLKFSDSDLKFTVELERALNFVNVRLLDHIIVSDGKYLSMINQLNVD